MSKGIEGASPDLMRNLFFFSHHGWECLGGRLLIEAYARALMHYLDQARNDLRLRKLSFDLAHSTHVGL